MTFSMKSFLRNIFFLLRKKFRLCSLNADNDRQYCFNHGFNNRNDTRNGSHVKPPGELQSSRSAFSINRVLLAKNGGYGFDSGPKDYFISI